MANSFRNDVYRSARKLSYIPIGLLGALIVLCILFIIASFILILAPDSVIDLGEGESLVLGYGLIGIVALLHIPVFIATVASFLIWEYRSFNNLSPLKARNLEFSPGWAVGWWFVPIALLFKPFQAMRELWVESDPEYDEDLGFLSSHSSAPTLMGFWWALWILMGIADRISNSMSENAAFPVVLIIASSLEIGAAGLLIHLVKDIVDRQETRFSRVGGDQLLPPEPPKF